MLVSKLVKFKEGILQGDASSVYKLSELDHLLEVYGERKNMMSWRFVRSHKEQDRINLKNIFKMVAFPIIRDASLIIVILNWMTVFSIF